LTVRLRNLRRIADYVYLVTTPMAIVEHCHRPPLGRPTAYEDRTSLDVEALGECLSQQNAGLLTVGTALEPRILARKFPPGRNRLPKEVRHRILANLKDRPDFRWDPSVARDDWERYVRENRFPTFPRFRKPSVPVDMRPNRKGKKEV
jgi:hypothetical protein